MNRLFSLRFQIFLFTALSGFIPLILTVLILNYSYTHVFEDRLQIQVLDIASFVADDGDVKQAFIEMPNNQQLLQKISNEIKQRTGAYVMFLNMEGTVLTHPYPTKVGQQIMGGDEGPALAGESYVSKAEGFVGPTIRGYVPIIHDNKQIGVVVAAFLDPDIKFILSQTHQSIYIVVPLALLLIIILSLLLANNIKKRLFGMEPIEIGTSLMEREGILHSVREGIIATDGDLKIKVINQSAEKLFPENTNLIGARVNDLISDLPLTSVISTKKPQYNQHHSINDHVVLTNIFPLFVKDIVVGTVITIQTITEVNLLAEELTGVKRIVEGLRARTHEFSNKLHAISGLLQLGSYEEAKRYVSSAAKDENTLLSCLLSNFKVNTITGLLLGKASEAEEKKISFLIDPDSALYALPEYFNEHSSVIVLGNLIENAFDAVKNSTVNPEVYVSISQSETDIVFEVQDNGSGVPPDNKQKIFKAGFTTKENGTGYGLQNVSSRVNAAGGAISYTTGLSGTTFKVIIPFDILAVKGEGGN